MPQLNFTFVNQNLRTEIFNSAIEGIAPDFQAAIELELKTAQNADGLLNAASFGPALTTLNKAITSIVETYYSVTFKNIPANIVKLLQELINTNSKYISKLNYAYFTTEQDDAESSIEWTPDFTGTKEFIDQDFDDDEFDDDDFDFVPAIPVKNQPADTDDGFVVIPNNVVSPVFASTTVIGNLLAANKSVALTPPQITDSTNSLSLSTLILTRNLSADSDTDLSASTSSSLLDSFSLAELQRQLSQSEIELKSSNEDLSRSMTEYDKLLETTRPKIQNLLALRSLERFNNKQFNMSKSQFIHSSKVVPEKQPNIPAIRQEREAASYQSFVSLATIYNQHHYKNVDVTTQEKKLAASKLKHEKLQQEYIAMSCPPSFFAARTSEATKTASVAQSVVLQQNMSMKLV
jgi:hypothetical protein